MGQRNRSRQRFPSEEWANAGQHPRVDGDDGQEVFAEEENETSHGLLESLTSSDPPDKRGQEQS